MNTWRFRRQMTQMLTVVLVGGIIFLPPAARAEGITRYIKFSEAQQQMVDLVVHVNRSVIITFDQPLARVSFADPSIAEAVVISPIQLLLNGKEVGASSMLAWSARQPDRPVAFTVRVVADIGPVIEQVRRLFPDESLNITQLGGRVILSGTVSSQEVIERILPLFEGAGVKVVNLTTVPAEAAPAQVMLRVRVAEVNRRVLRDLGATYSLFNPLAPRTQNEAVVGPNVFNSPSARFANRPIGPDFTFSDAVNLFVFNPGTSLGAFIRALKQRNAFRSLAEPNIIVVDGQEASFLAGGEFPFAVVQPSSAGTSITIQFKEFGVRLKFTPHIIGDRIRLELEPEVSALDFSNALQLAGFVVPSLRTRRARTTVELADGQSFALAGLLSNDMTKISSKVPLLGDIPVIGHLFRSQSYIKNETELVFLCTTRLVKPLEPDEVPPLPGVESSPSGGLEGVFGHHVPAAAPQEKAPGAKGQKPEVEGEKPKKKK